MNSDLRDFYVTRFFYALEDAARAENACDRRFYEGEAQGFFRALYVVDHSICGVDRDFWCSYEFWASSSARTQGGAK
jgi:hypothetical protein